jgi:ribose 1,5-bisphosphate isomerase
MQELQTQAARITSLEIQGATNIALFAIKIFDEFVQRHKDESSIKLWRMVREAEDVLKKSRSTEPTLRNGLLFIIGKVREHKKNGEKPVPIAAYVHQYAEDYVKKLNGAKYEIAKIGAKRIPHDPVDHFTIMTHCHSSIVEAILIEAHKQGRKFDVICTETRPKFQGRITAKVLSEAGIKVQMVVDSAMRWAVKNREVAMIIIGADAITSEGTVMNKIGSRLLALVADEENIPFYVASPLFKYNLGTLTGELEKIDRRDSNEVWSEKETLHLGTRPKDIEILNPAFETVNRKYIDAIITESGLFPPDHTHLMFEKNYPFLVEGSKICEDEYEGWE